LAKRFLPVFGCLLIAGLAPVSAGISRMERGGSPASKIASDGTTETATCALIGAALCLVGWQLRRRRT
jgi:hypothetical protein